MNKTPQTYPGYMSAIPRKRTKGIDDIPQDKLLLWATRLYSMCNLAWDYIDTIANVCTLYRIADTRPLIRQLRQLRRDYEIFRQRDIHGQTETEEIERGLSFEESFSKDFHRLNIAVNDHLSTITMPEDRRMLQAAAMQAKAICDATLRYGKWIDKQMRKLGLDIPDYVLVQNEFIAASRLLPKFMNSDISPLPPIHSQQIAARIHIFGHLRHIQEALQIEKTTNSQN